MEACYGGTDVMERSCAVARGIDINTPAARAFSVGECRGRTGVWYIACM